ncbi:hypothetical protein E1281_37055 [Actinomadura sp. KC345]|nr:hypothetical protein E1281_37055 [Actinomadura sp. KC345]
MRVAAFESAPPTRPLAAPPGPSKPPRSWHRSGLAIGVAAFVGVAAVFGVLRLTSDDGEPASNPPSAPVAADLGKKPPEVDDTVIDDNFSDEASGWKTAASPIWDASYRDRKYELHVLPTTNRTVVGAPVDDVPESQLIEVKVEHTAGEGGEAGVYCHGEADGFAFLLREDGRVRIAKLGSTPENLAAGTATDLRGSDDRIQAACLDDGSGTTLDMWVNGEHVASTSAEAPEDEPGASGVILYRPDDAEGHPEATFDNFALCSV